MIIIMVIIMIIIIIQSRLLVRRYFYDTCLKRIKTPQKSRPVGPSCGSVYTPPVLTR